MADEQDTDTEARQGFWQRRKEGTKRYVSRRFGNQFLKAGYKTMKNNLAGARNAMTPKTFDLKEFREGFEGRYHDGGVKRFAEMVKMEKIAEYELVRMARDRAWSAKVMLAAAVIFFLVGGWMMLTAERGQDILFGFSTSFMAFLFGALAIRHDYSRWQIEQRRFGGFREYMTGEKPVHKPGYPNTEIAIKRESRDLRK